MLIDIQLGQCTDIDLEFIFFWQIMGQRIIQTMNAFDHQNILLTKLHIMSVIFPFSGLEIERRKLFHFSYQRYLENCIRNVFGLEGTPVIMSIREKGDKED